MVKLSTATTEIIYKQTYANSYQANIFVLLHSSKDLKVLLKDKENEEQRQEQDLDPLFAPSPVVLASGQFLTFAAVRVDQKSANSWCKSAQI